MAGFFGIALRNFFHAPTTDPYPFGETFLPDAYRGIIAWDKDTCIGCSTCEHVCPAGAIRVTETEDKINFSFWMNSCTFCGNCGYFCPTGAVGHSTDFHTVTVRETKYNRTVDGDVLLVTCAKCDKKIRPMVDALLVRTNAEIIDEKRNNAALCPECRRMKQFERLYK